MTGYKADFSVAILNEQGQPRKLEAVITGPDDIQRRVDIDINAKDPKVPDNWLAIAAGEADYQRGQAGQAGGSPWRPW